MMTKNVWQPIPSDDSQDSLPPKRRGFRWTTFELDDCFAVIKGPFRDAVRFSLFQQLPLLLVAVMILDHGLIFKRVAIAAVAYWVLVLILMTGRGTKATSGDILMLKWSYVPILILTCVIWYFGGVMFFS